MQKLLGANWFTTVSGWATILAGAIALDPGLISFLPGAIQPTVKGVCGLIAVVSGGAFAYQVKSKNVTGGTVQQTATGAVAEPTTVSSTSVLETHQSEPKS